MPTFNYSGHHLHSDVMFPKHPGLIRAANWLFVLDILSIFGVAFLAVFFPQPWLIIGICASPFLVFIVPIICVFLWYKGRYDY
jgi:hypothetical protein